MFMIFQNNKLILKTSSELSTVNTHGLKSKISSREVQFDSLNLNNKYLNYGLQFDENSLKFRFIC